MWHVHCYESDNCGQGSKLMRCLLCLSLGPWQAVDSHFRLSQPADSRENKSSPLCSWTVMLSHRLFLLRYVKVDWDVLRWTERISHHFKALWNVMNVFCFKSHNFSLFVCLFGSFRPGVFHMDALIHRCPFLTVVPTCFFHLARRSSLITFARKCPVMMDLVSTPLARALSSAASLPEGSPSNNGQSCQS